MKGLAIIIPALMLFTQAGAQDIKQQLISTAGSYDVSADNSVSLSWTIGELIPARAASAEGDVFLSQGGQQLKHILTGIEINPGFAVDIQIYPNPAGNILNIKFPRPLNNETLVSLSGPDGRLVYSDKIKPAVIIKEIYMQKYPPGVYFLRLQCGNKLNVYKIIKL